MANTDSIRKYYMDIYDEIDSLEKEQEKEKELLKLNNKYSHKIGELNKLISDSYTDILLSWTIKENKYYLGWYSDRRMTWMEYHDDNNMVIKVKLVCISETTHSPYGSGRDGVYEFIVDNDVIDEYINYHLDNNIEPDVDVTKLRDLA